MASKQLLNNPERVVTEAIEGLLASTELVRLDAFPHIKVVVDPSHDRSKVAVISGGGSGHEPAMAGYVGQGMLAAAVAGEVFASPSEDAVLAAIRAVAGPAGCLVIVMNYTGDRLNFGAAIERAKAEGLAAELVVIADDCALQGKSAVGRRGIAGTVLVHKVAGAAAAAGFSLAEVKAAAEAAAAGVATIGCSLTPCTLPGQPPSSRLGPEEMEVGLGIHGEPGAYRERVRPADEIVVELMRRIAGEEGCYLPTTPGDRVALMVNNLGSATALEMGIVTRAAVQQVTQRLQARLERVWCGTFMTSLDMHGFSLTLMRVTDASLALLDSPTAAPAWPKARGAHAPDKRPLPLPAGATDAPLAAGAAAEGGELLGRLVGAACDAVAAAEADLNALDAQVGDGDCGSTLARGAAAVQRALGHGGLPLADPGATLLALGQLLGQSMGGSSGALYKIMLTAGGTALARGAAGGGGGDGGGAPAAAAALSAGVCALVKYAGAQRGSRTMLDALIPAAGALEAAAAAAQLPAVAAAAAAAAAAEGAEATAAMTSAGAGRSSYVPAEKLTVRDPGAEGVARWLAAVAAALKD